MRTIASSAAACLALPLVLAIGGCVVRGQGGTTTPPPNGGAVVVNSPPGGAVAVNSPQMGSGVQIVEANCQPNAPEQCNGLDDNCNGQIDEGCGFQSGQVQITLAWNIPADLDLYVTDPTGATLNYSNAQVPSGGRLDHDARGQCRPDEPNNTIENVFWTGQPPPGPYRIAVDYWMGDCDQNLGPAVATVSISIGGRVQQYNVPINPGQRIDVATFSL